MQVQEQVLLGPLTTLGIGGRARYFVRAGCEDEVREAVLFARAEGLRLFTLGGGSNLVVPDAGFDGLVVHAVPGEGMRWDGGLLEVDGGMDWDGLVRAVCVQGLSGVECLAGIPGLVGGSPIQNIGAYGQEVASTLHSVRALDLQTMEFVTLAHAACGFGYRRSIFNSTERGRYLVTRVTFSFAEGRGPNLSYVDLTPLRERAPSMLEVYDFVRAVRDRKGMLIDTANRTADSRSAGSFFKNPLISGEAFEGMLRGLGLAGEGVPHWVQETGGVKLAAAWLIERAGFGKGFALGPVGISTKHTLALVNRTGTATCAELMELRDVIVAGVEERFGVWLEMEPIVLG